MPIKRNLLIRLSCLYSGEEKGGILVYRVLIMVEQFTRNVTLKQQPLNI